MKLSTNLVALATGAALLGCQLPRHDGAAYPLNNLRGPTRDLSLELHEGTNMAAAPSPDGRRIVFSAQGALWVMPATGGVANRITSWRVEPTAPVWSPDGKTIAFQNYTPEGNFHIWTVKPDGSALAELTSGPYDDREPAWLPDGGGLVFSSDRSNDGAYKIWRVALAGRALGQLTHGPGAESHPVVAPDGARLAYVDAGNVYTLALGAGAAPLLVAPGAAPAWTPDGSALVYQNADRQLVVGAAVVTHGEDLFPFPVRFLPGGGFLYTADGKIRVRDAAGANRADVAFSATLMVRRPLFDPGRERGIGAPGPRPVRGISAPVISPDGGSIAFVALNDVWTMRIGQAPVRLTNDTDRDAHPQWSADGSAVYFSSDRGNAGQLAIDQVVVATGARTRLAAIPGKSMVSPKMSPSGDRIAYIALSGQLEIWHRASRTSEVIIAAAGIQVSTPSWTADGSRIMLVDNEAINNRFREGYNKLRVIDLATRQAVFHPVAVAPRQVADRDEGAAVLAPDGTRVAFIMDSLLHVMRVHPDGAPAGPAVPVTLEPGDLPSWAGDSQTILYKTADTLKTVRVGGGRARAIPVDLAWTEAAPAGTTLIRAGALWDGISPSLHTDVDILISGNRISSIRPHQAGSESSAARFIDASGLTVMPGLWDAHVHPLALAQGSQVGQVAALMLAYGQTTAQSAGGPLHQSVELREALAAGRLIGPRLLVAPPLWEGNRLFYSFARSLRTPVIAEFEIAKAKAMQVDSLKAYVRAPIPVMIRIAQGALDLGVPSLTHLLSPGAATGLRGTAHLSATERMGYGWSKSSAGAITYQDAVDLYGKGDFHLIDTLFSAGALSALDPAIVGGERFVLVPPNFVAALRDARPPSAAVLANIRRDAEQQAKVLRAGAIVANGTDTPVVVPGISLHLNLRAAGMAMTNFEALQTVTINAARFALLDRHLGSVEAGKLADLVAVRGNPLQDLTAAANVEYVVKNGNVFTLAQILAPFRTPQALAERERALAGYDQMCRANPAPCAAPAHAH